jgi:site-specific recombinase XerD
MNLRSFGLIFFLRKGKESKKNIGLVPIYMRITVNEVRSEISMKKLVDPNKWDSSAGKIKGNKEEIKSTNEYLDREKAKVLTIKEELLNKGGEISAEIIKNKYLGFSKPENTILKVFEEHNNNLKARLNNDYALATWKRYSTTYEHIKSFIKEKYHKNDLPLDNVDHEFISGFEHFLKTKENKCSHNTSMKYLGHFKKITNYAINNDWLIKNPYRNHKISFKKINYDFLLWEEIEKIATKEIKVSRLELIRDLFVFACYTAFEYVDLLELNVDHYEMETDGTCWLIKPRRKTNIICYVPLFQVAKEIIEKYKEYPKKKDNLLLPVLSNQKLNAYLKEIADLCEINKDISFLTARRSFASVVGFKMGLSAESIRMVMGHSDLTMTTVYSQPDKTKILNDLKNTKL